MTRERRPGVETKARFDMMRFTDRLSTLPWILCLAIALMTVLPGCADAPSKSDASQALPNQYVLIYNGPVAAEDAPEASRQQLKRLVGMSNMSLISRNFHSLSESGDLIPDPDPKILLVRWLVESYPMYFQGGPIFYPEESREHLSRGGAPRGGFV